MINERHRFRINLTELTSFSLITLGPRRLFGGSSQNLSFYQMQRLFKGGTYPTNYNNWQH